jgi:hypothetical protein
MFNVMRAVYEDTTDHEAIHVDTNLSHSYM